MTDVTTFPGATNSLRHIRKIKITGTIMEFTDVKNLSKILIGLSRICTRIHDIEVYKFCEENFDLLESLIALIKT